MGAEVSYLKVLDNLSKQNRRLLPHISRVTDPLGRMIPGWHVDHIVPRWFGYDYSIPVEEMASVENMQILSHVDNWGPGRHAKGSKLPEDWIADITEVNWEYSCDILPKWDQSLLRVCQEIGLSYILAASAFVKQWPREEVVVQGIRMMRRNPGSRDVEDW